MPRKRKAPIKKGINLINPDDVARALQPVLNKFVADTRAALNDVVQKGISRINGVKVVFPPET